MTSETQQCHCLENQNIIFWIHKKLTAKAKNCLTPQYRKFVSEARGLMFDFYSKRRSIRIDKCYRLTPTQSENIDILDQLLSLSSKHDKTSFTLQAHLEYPPVMQSFFPLQEHTAELCNSAHERGIVSLCSESAQRSVQSGIESVRSKVVSIEGSFDPGNQTSVRSKQRFLVSSVLTDWTDSYLRSNRLSSIETTFDRTDSHSSNLHRKTLQKLYIYI